VDQLRTFTIGGVTEAGGELFRTVSIDIEATFSNQHAGFLQEGKRANIQLDTFASNCFGFMLDV
jgi:hypothetical protein